MDLEQILRQIELFQGLDEDQLRAISSIFREQEYGGGDIIAQQGDRGDSLSVISDGFVEVAIRTRNSEDIGKQILINLGRGQIFGEMSLVDQGPRSASVTAISTPTRLQVVQQSDFEKFCADHPQIGFIVMRNIAADLSFKLRKQNLAGI